ncbi:MAG TPA: XdhC/CoxI family protein [Gemmatimonadaceae bacterium]|nr:XdhC/CoxI family protein [Gemmatimonadaceae bacterium]
MSRSDLQDTFAQLDHVRAAEPRAAMATLVSTKGTTPRKEGAKMWVSEQGRLLGSVTIGGCVDARVIQASEQVLRSGTAELLTMSLGDADAWDMGLTCGGMVQVLIEPVSLRDAGDPIVCAYASLRAEREAGRHAVSVAPLSGVAARLVVREDGTTAGTLGSTALDDEAREHAMDVMRRAASCTSALSAAGDALYFFELHGPATTLIIFGAGQVAIPLVTIARSLGWRTVVVDNRERHATRERFPEADEIRLGMLGDEAERLTYDASTVAVIVAHDYKYELPVLRVLLQREPAYIGLLGNAGRGHALLGFLADEGYDAGTLERVHVPVGLHIGAGTAAEIALSIAAEIVAVRAGRDSARHAHTGSAS